jgi:hypothetical protein
MFSIAAPLSQAVVPGAEQACTAIAVVACAHRLFPRSTAALGAPALMELCIRQGGALYACWRLAFPAAPGYAITKEMVDLVSPALPICLGDELGGALWVDGEGDDSNVSLPQALQSLDAAMTCVLTIGAFSVALFLDAAGRVELFDSHALAEMANQTGALFRFESRDECVAYLMERFPTATVAYSLSVIRTRMHHPPTTFPVQNQAFDRADRLPPGFFYVFARDTNRSTGAKEYLVAGLEDFYSYYCKIEPELRTYYDMARASRPVTLYLDLEYESYDENRECNGREMLETLLKLVAEENQMRGVDSFRIFDSSSAQPPLVQQPVSEGEVVEENDGPVAMSLVDEEEEEEEEQEEEENGEAKPMSLVEEHEDMPLTKVSFHVHNNAIWFANTVDAGAFMKRVEQRSAAGQLRVWRFKRDNMVEEFFADQGVYTSNRCFRLVYSTKIGKMRPFLPLDMDASVAMDPAAFFGAILSPPMPQLYTMVAPAVACDDTNGVAAPSSLALSRSSSNAAADGIMSLSASAPLAIRLLGDAVANHYKPERMRGFQLTPTGLVTFSMIKHDCEICNDRHNNQVYVVADLKSRVFYSKCHADRSKAGPEVPFPASLGPLSMAHDEEMQAGERAAVGIFPATSYTAHMVLGFAGAIYKSARTAPRIPEPGTAAVHYDKIEEQYEVALPETCAVDHGQMVLQVSKDKLVIRCKGKMCKVKGKRWDRPSHSATAAGRWKLLFLFPATASSTELAVASSSSSALVSLSCGSNAFPIGLSPEAFLGESNFIRAIGFDSSSGAPLFMYKDRLDQIDEWAAIVQKENGSIVHELAQQVRHKTHIVRGILSKEMMEVCYRECLAVAPDFVYPIELLPRGPSTLASALWIHLARRRGYKRTEDTFHVPTVDAAGRNFYRAVPLDNLLTSVCTFDLTPNLCSAVMWNGRVGDDLRRLLNDRNEFPSLAMSKRFLGYANAVYDLEENVALTWEQVRADPTIMPFNFIDQQFPVDMLEQAKANCPKVSIGVNAETGKKEVKFDGPLGCDFVPTPLFDGPLLDQEFSPATMFWLYALLGRMFHYISKKGDNWEIVLFLIGAPSSFKSSIIAILSSFFQPDQVGVIGTNVESTFPLDGVLGKLVALMTECASCTLARDLYKLIGSGDPVRVNGKYKTAINVPNWIIPLLFGGNAFMDMPDTDGSVERRSAVFPFLFMLRDGEGATDLAQRIFAEEGPLLLIKWNTLYLELCRVVKVRIQSLLPTEIREATRQCIMANDSFKSFLGRDFIVTDSSDDRIPWTQVWSSYLQWCKTAGRAAYAVDPLKVEVQAMFKRMGVRLSRKSNPVSLVRIRARTLNDPPFQNIFEVRDVRRGHEQDADGSSASSEEEEEDDE